MSKWVSSHQELLDLNSSQNFHLILIQYNLYMGGNSGETDEMRFNKIIELFGMFYEELRTLLD